MTDAERIKELEAEMLNNAKTAQLIIDGLEAKLEKAVGALKLIAKPALGGKLQQYTAQHALADLEPKEGA